MKRNYWPFCLCLLCGCSFYDDGFIGKPAAHFEVTVGGFAEAVFFERHDSLFVSVKNVKGSDLKNLFFLVQLYSKSPKTGGNLKLSAWLKKDINKNSSVEIYLTKGYNPTGVNTIRFEVISVDDWTLLPNVSSGYEGTYTVFDNTTSNKSINLLQGYCNYKGDFLFEAQGTTKPFTFLKGTTMSDLSFNGHFLKDDDSVIASTSGACISNGDSLILKDIVLSSQLTVTMKLKKLKP